MLLSIVNDKVVNGLESHFDGDSMQHTAGLSHPSVPLPLPKHNEYDDNIEFIFERDTDKERNVDPVECQEVTGVGNNGKHANKVLNEKKVRQPLV